MFEEKYDCYTRISGISNLAEALKENKPINRIAYNWDGQLDQQEDFDYVCRLVFECKEICFMVEEISLYCSPSHIPRPLAKIISLGRHKGLSFYCTSQTPKQINILIRSQASEIISFAQTEPAHIDWCRQVMGEDADKLNQLQRYHCLQWTPEQSVIRDANFNPLDKSARPVIESEKITEGSAIINPVNPNPIIAPPPNNSLIGE